MKVSVIIPTYNRAEMLRDTLNHLTRQDISADDFEVIVSDDGSTDHTKDVVDSFAGQLHMKYHFMEYLGFRAGHARNAGARMASAPLLVFLDTGGMVGPGFLRAHLAEHARPGGPRAIVGYAYGYNPDYGHDQVDAIAEAMSRMLPEQVVEHFTGKSWFLDIRHGLYEKYDFDLSRMVIPWLLFFTINVSVPAKEFHEVGGFDEGFDRWGCEDMHLGFRLFRSGVPLVLSRTAWALEYPHERDRANDMQDVAINLQYFLRGWEEPQVELLALLIPRLLFGTIDDECRAVLDWAASVRDLDVSAEIDAAVKEIAPTGRIVVIGAGGRVPPSLPPATLFDVDRDLLQRATAGGGHTGHHRMGLLTGLEDQSVDAVVITSRLAGLWDRWSEDLLAEAGRVGRKIHVTFSAHS
ncbi:hypothetical protein Aple_057320 [Acrocarpospora pleiomorpha]|uniref:Glycosyltransferase 2-like domain-containing protein n=1 Tax=Acrocarpospora pleiomorpha TaxID=90975 RepID=A0A5M3XU65_9ACTN|nr:glycosyltransferase [Acrocarpospora pleiomorpha]GES22833.1 hypothetical protein Aple_057320 [Acrocarpospora pleiomorpha]